MLDTLLSFSDWTEPPAEMEFSSSYGALVKDIVGLVERLRQGAWSGTDESWKAARADAVSLYVRTPGIVNVMLNYKICVEHDLPLHPTVYYELKEARKYRMDHGLPAVDKANRLYRQSIALARSALGLSPGFEEQAREFLAELPPELLAFLYTGIRDAYTWRASNPEILDKLAKSILSSYSPQIMLGAAHGSIMPALYLAEILGIPLYFIRFSMFKRNDEEPIITFSDKAWLYGFKDSNALLYDEDVAGGRTLSLFSEKMGPLFGTMKTSCSIRHAGASIKPDFCGKVWWD